MAEPIGALRVELSANAARFEKDMGRARGAVVKANRDMGRALGQFRGDMQRSVKGIATMRSALVGLGAVFSINQLRTTFGRFETSLQQIVGLVGVAQSEVNQFRDAILALGPAVGKGPGELADALFFITSAGLKGQTALDALTASAKASAAGLGVTKSVADAVTSAVNAYAASNLTAAEATDVLVATVREGKLEAAELSGSIGKVLSVAEQAGVTFNEVGATIAALTRIGLSASESVTALRGVLVALNRQSKTGADALAEYGLSYEALKESIKSRGLLATLRDLRNTIGDNEKALVDIFGEIEAVNGVLALTGGNAESVTGVFERMADVTGVLDKAFGAVSETTEQKFNQGLAKLEAVAIQLGSVVIPKLAQGLDLLVNNLREVTAAVAGFVAFKVATVMGSIAVATYKFATAIRVATVATTGLSVALRANPVGLFATVIGAGVAALIGFSDAKADATDASRSHTDALTSENEALRTQGTLLNTTAERMQSLRDVIADTERQLEILRNLRGVDLPSPDEGTVGIPGLSNFDVLRVQAMGVEAVIAELEGRVESYNKQLAELDTQTKETVTTTGGMTRATSDASDKIAELVAEQQFELDQLRRTSVEQELYSLAKKAGIEVNEQFVESLKPIIEELDNEKKAQDAAKEAAENASRTREELANRGRQITEETRTAQEKYNDDLAELNDLYWAGEISAETYRRKLEELKKELEDQDESLQKNKQFTKDLGMTFASAFEDAIVKGGDLSDVLRGLEQDLIRLATRRFITEPLFNAVGGLFSGFDFGSIFGGGGGSVVPPASIGAGVAGFATGGSFKVGGAAGIDRNIVPLRLSRGESVDIRTPAQQRSASTAMMGGTISTDVTVNVYAPPGSKVEQRESAGPQGRQIDIMIDEMTATNIMTPGSRTSRAMQQNFAGLNKQLQGR